MCTRTFWGDNGVAAVVSRTLDFRQWDSPAMWYLPPGVRRCGNTADPQLTWTSAHASLSIVDYGELYLDGLNSAGLAAHTLMFTSAEYEPADVRPSLLTTLWSQFVLDTCATVAEAVEALSGVRIAPAPFGGGDGGDGDGTRGRVGDVPALFDRVGVHLAVEDDSGDSAVFEPVDGRILVTHGREFPVMANSPSMPEQLANLARHRPFGGELPVPGDVTSQDRFVRASYLRHYLPPPADPREALAGVVHVASAVSKPPGVPYPSGEVYPTRWISAADLTNLDYYFWSRSSPALVWASLGDLAGGDEPMTVDLFTPDLAGDVVGAMRPGAAPGVRA